jgi:hypothetical protein
MGWVIGIIIGGIIAALGIINAPDIKRYMRMRKM